MLMLAVLCLLNNQARGKYSIGLENTTVMSVHVHTWLRAAAAASLGLLLKPGTGRDKRGISRPVPPTKTRDGIEFYCKRIRRKQRKGSRLLERGTELLGVTTSAAAGEE